MSQTGQFFVGSSYRCRGSRARATGRDVLCERLEDHAEKNRCAYDVVTSFQVIEHVADPMAFLVDLMNCIRPGGTVIVAAPNDDSFVGAEINGILNMPPHHVTRWPPSALQYALAHAGASEVVVHTEPLAEDHELEFFTQILLRALLNARANGVPLVRADLRFRLASRVASIIARWLARSMIATQHGVVGHNMVAVGRKP